MINFQDMYRKAFDVWRAMEDAQHDADIVDSIFNAMLAAHAAGFALGHDAGFDDGYDTAEQEQADEIAEATKAFGMIDVMDNSDVITIGPGGPNSFFMVNTPTGLKVG